MKSRIICLVLCIVSLAASMFLLVDTVKKDMPEINRGEKKEEVVNPIAPPVDFESEKTQLSETGVSAFAIRVQKFVTRLAYEEDKSFETERNYIIENARDVASWLLENEDASGSEYLLKVAELFEKSKTEFTSDEAFGTCVSKILADIDASYSALSENANLSLYPVFDTNVGGELTLALLSIHLSQTNTEDTFTVSVGGSALLGDRLGTENENSFKSQWQNSKYSFPMYKLSAVLKNDDMSFITLLAPLTESAESEVLDPVKGSPEYVKGLVGVDCVSVAPFEIMDYGEVGYQDTLTTLSDNSISYSVHNGSSFKDTAFGKIVYITFDLTDTPVTDEQKDKNKEVVKNAVQTERENGADLIVVMLNWNTRLRKSDDFSADYKGDEISAYEQHFDAYNKEIARAAIGDGVTGANLVVGTGAHVIQGIENYKGRMIVYSPGDITCSTPLDSEKPNTAYSFIFTQTFEKTESGIESKNFRVIPFVNTSVTEPFTPTPVFDSRADSIVDILRYRSSYFANPITDFNYIKIEK